jgi:hypothetical protein
LFQHRYFDPKGLVSVGRPFLAVYDLEQAVHELYAGGFPDLDELLTESLLEPVHPDEVSEFFERHALDGHSGAGGQRLSGFRFPVSGP